MEDKLPVCWDGTDEAFWGAVLESAKPTASRSDAILCEVLQLAKVRAAMLYRSTKLAADGYRSQPSTFQLMQDDFDLEHYKARQEQYAERCRQLLAESAYKGPR